MSFVNDEDNILVGDSDESPTNFDDSDDEIVDETDSDDSDGEMADRNDDSSVDDDNSNGTSETWEANRRRNAINNMIQRSNFELDIAPCVNNTERIDALDEFDAMHKIEESREELQAGGAIQAEFKVLVNAIIGQ